jgi:cell wall-associated NlpC family hydrolase
VLAFARSTLPVKRVASSSVGPNASEFAALLRNASSLTRANKPTTLSRVNGAAATYHAPMISGAGPSPMSRSEILRSAQELMNVPYVWGGTSATGLDCSAFVSKAWGIARHTTDSLSSVAQAISKEELETGDALNLTTGKDPDGTGHVRLFDRWANAEHTKMYVYEETPPRSVHHVINWDANYQPMRRMNVIDA